MSPSEATMRPRGSRLLEPVFAESGVQSMFQFFTGALDIAYLGIAPFLLGHAYGLQLRIVAVAQELLTSHAVVLRRPTAKEGPLRIGTVLASTGHILAWRWAQEARREVVFVNLSPPDQLKAFEFGFVDGVSTWEPYTSRIQGTEHAVVHTAADDSIPHFNLLCANEPALTPDRREMIEDFLQAHRTGVRLLHDDRGGRALDYVLTVLGVGLPQREYRDILKERYRWPLDHFLDGVPPDHRIGDAIEAASEFLRATGMVPELAPQPLYPVPMGDGTAGEHAESSARPEGALRVGYTDSVMCAPFFAAQAAGIFEDAGFLIARDAIRNVERVALLDESMQTDLALIRRLIDDEPELAVLRIGQINERVLVDIFERSFRRSAPTPISKTLARLAESAALPAVIATSSDWIRRVRNEAKSAQGRTGAEIAHRAYEHLLDVVEWEQQTREERILRCGECSDPVEAPWKNCPRCGARLEPSCEACEQSVRHEWNFCPSCNNPLRGDRG